MSVRTVRIFLATMLAAIALVGGSVPAGASSNDDDFIQPAAKAFKAELSEPIAVLDLDNGDKIAFTPMLSERGETESVMVTGVRSADRAPISSIEGLDDADPLELFKALAPKGTAAPKQLVELYADGRTHRADGWARDLVLDGGRQHLTCPAYHWQDQMDHYSGLFGDTPFTSAWNGPSTQPQDWASYAPGDGTIAHRLFGQVDDVTSFYSAVLYCVEDFENGTVFNGDEVGVYVTSYYRPAGHGTWGFSGQLELNDVGDMYEHIYVGPSGPGAPSYDFRIRISLAKELDQFHIGATWVDGPPSDYKYGG